MGLAVSYSIIIVTHFCMTEQSKSFHLHTSLIREQVRSEQGEHSESIYATSSFCFDTAEQAAQAFGSVYGENVYSRFSNPSTDTFAKRIAIMEHAHFGIATASGMAAINLLMLAHLQAGDHIVASASLFGSTVAALNNVYPKFGVEVDFVELSDIDSWNKAIKPNTKLFFLETPSNPLCELVDLAKLVTLAKAHNILTCVDNCFCTPVLMRPIDFGVDVVMHSATKYLDGQGRFLGGALVLNDQELFEKLYTFLKITGAALSPVNAWTFSKSLETLELRMVRHCDNARGVANWLVDHPNVERIYYLGLPSHRHHELAKVQQEDFGGIVSFEVKGRQQEAWNMINHTRMLSITGNFGDTRTTITHPFTTTHGRLTPEQKDKARIKDNLIRLSIGLEKVEDIIADLDQALAHI